MGLKAQEERAVLWLSSPHQLPPFAYHTSPSSSALAGRTWPLGLLSQEAAGGGGGGEEGHGGCGSHDHPMSTFLSLQGGSQVPALALLSLRKTQKPYFHLTESLFSTGRANTFTINCSGFDQQGVDPTVFQSVFNKKDFRPVTNFSIPTRINISFTLSAILEVVSFDCYIFL